MNQINYISKKLLISKNMSNTSVRMSKYLYSYILDYAKKLDFFSVKKLNILVYVSMNVNELTCI